MNDIYLHPHCGWRWAISRHVDGRCICLVQDSTLDDPEDAHRILGALGIEASTDALDCYFPFRRGKGRCPTLELMELCNVLDPTNPVAKQQKGECGV